MDASNARVGITGAVYRAPAGTAPPTSPTEVLSSAFVELGYITDAGLRESNDDSTNAAVGWVNAAVVRSELTSSSTRFRLTLLETSAATLQTYHRGSTVTAEPGGVYRLEVKPPRSALGVWVFDVVDGSKLIRIVVGKGEVVERGDVTYSNGELVAYPIEVQAYPDADGNVCVKMSNDLAWAPVWTVVNGRILRPDGTEMIAAGLNGGVHIGTGESFSIAADVSVGWAYDGFPGLSGRRYSDVWTTAPQLVAGTECFPGGTVGPGRYWNHAPLDGGDAPITDTIVTLPDRVYALTGELSQAAIDFGIPEPADHWHVGIFRVNAHIRNGPPAERLGPITLNSAPTRTAAQTVPEYVAQVRALVDAGLVVCPEFHDRTAVVGQPDYTVPAELLANPMLDPADLADGYIRDSLLFYDALVAEFTASDNVWIGLPNEFNQDGRTTAYDNVIVTLARRLWGKGWRGITTLPLPRWAGDLAALARGDLDSLVDQLEQYQQGPIVWEWHNYGDRYDAAGTQSVGTWAQVDADIAACRNGVPGSGRKHAVWMSEYGQPVPSGTGLPHAPDGVRLMATNTDGPALGIKYPHLCATWWSTADNTFNVRYALTKGAANKASENSADPNTTGPRSGVFPWWKITSTTARDEWLTTGGRAHWDLAHAIWQS